MEDATVIEESSDSASWSPVDWSTPGLFVLNLVHVFSCDDRVEQAGAVATALLGHGKATLGTEPILLVVDEAQNYAPEQTTGRLSLARVSFDALFEIATEGRKFNCRLLISSQRPARVNKDILSQCNTQMIFRMVSEEDLAAVAGCFEEASAGLLAALPGYETGTSYAGGVSLAMGVAVAWPLAGGITAC